MVGVQYVVLTQNKYSAHVHDNESTFKPEKCGVHVVQLYGTDGENISALDTC